jgi:hypothetical protein
LAPIRVDLLMNRLVSRLLLAVVGATSVVSVIPARAADLPPVPARTAPVPPPPASAWTFDLTAYLWAAGMNGTVGLGPAVPPVSVDVDFIDILKHLKMGFMGTFEARYANKIGLIADMSYLSVKVSAAGPAGFFNGELRDKTFFGTYAGAYRVLDSGSFWVDVLAGARVWSRSSTLTITGPGPIGISRGASKTWVDAVVGLRAQADLTPDVFVQLYADAGAGGAQSDWQAGGFLGYRYSKSTTLFAGYRYLSVDYSRSGYVFDVDLSGPMIGATFKF